MNIGILGLISIVLITLKLTGVVDWSWWLVTIPLWIGVAIFVAIFLFYWVAYTLNSWASNDK